VSYRFDFKKWQAGGEEKKQMINFKKKEIQK
jgi:hypothetical protein